MPRTLARSGSRGAQTGRGPAGGTLRDAVMLVGARGAYLNGWRNAPPALAPGTQKTSRVSSRLSATTIRVLPASRFHSSETVKPASWRVSRSTNTIGSFLASIISSAKTENAGWHQQCASWSAIAPVSLLGPSRHRPLVNRGAARRSPLDRAQYARRPLTGRGYFRAVYGATGVTDDLLWPHRSPSDDAKEDSASSPVSNPVSKPRVLDGGDVRTRRAGYVPSPHHRPHQGEPP
jgi:hypothetical protein